MFPTSYSFDVQVLIIRRFIFSQDISESGFRMRKKSTVPTRLITVRPINTVLGHSLGEKKKMKVDSTSHTNNSRVSITFSILFITIHMPITHLLHQ